MNHAFTSNYLSRFIYINLLDYLEFYLDFLLFLLYKKDGLLLHKEDLVEANVDILRIRSSHVQSALFLTILFMAFLVAFFYRAFFTLLLPNGKDAYL